VVRPAGVAASRVPVPALIILFYFLLCHVQTTSLSVAQRAILGRKSIILSVWRYIKGLDVLSHDLADHLSLAVRLSSLSVLTISEEIAHVFSGNACLDNICS